MKEELLQVLDQEAQRTDAEGIWPGRSIRALSQSGLLGLTLTSDAGAGAGMRRFAEVTEKIATHCASTAMIYLAKGCALDIRVLRMRPRSPCVLSVEF